MRLALARPADKSLSPRGKRALELARSEAARSGLDAVGPEQLLLGCLGTLAGAPARALEDAGLTVDAIRADVANGAAPRLNADALASIGIDLDEVRRRVEDRFGPGALERPTSARCRLALSAPPRKMLAAAARQARGHADPEHVLLALLDSEAAWILLDRGLPPNRLREAVLEEIAER
jgi:ATP-dependent Clp protease ATP-binding subunit ClpA